MSALDDLPVEAQIERLLDGLQANSPSVQAGEVFERVVVLFLAERDELRDRLAEVEAELAHGERAFDQQKARAGRLAQELEDALGHLRAVLDAWDPMAENYEMGPFFEAREFLARFPVKEGDEG